jgi:thiosulfate/3-mercaptopyruvate sulfurtransferase
MNMKSVSTIRQRILPFILLIPVFTALLFVPVKAKESSPKLVDTKWLKDNLSMENLRIVDLRDNVKDYWQEHIPGAVYLSPDAMRWPDRGVPVKLIQPEALTLLLGEMGEDENTMVVAYSEKGDYKAPYLIWALDYIGHKQSAVLDGGFSKWKSEGNLVIQGYPKIEPKQYRLPSKLNEEVRATLKEVKETMGQKDVVLIDVRPPELYTGQAGPWKRKGHIKGAINHFWGDDLKEDGTWKDQKDLKKIYENLGANSDKTVIVSCGQGQMSAHTYLTLKYVLGYPKVKNYDGSFNEWANIDELPVETSTGMSLNPENLLQERCTVCHDLDRVRKARRDRPGWEKTIAKMVTNGAKLNEVERHALVDYLSQKGK